MSAVITAPEERPVCEICEVEPAVIRCEVAGPLCFDCFGSGIHEAIRIKGDLLKEIFGEVRS
jgi:hypothetical protein